METRPAKDRDAAPEFAERLRQPAPETKPFRPGLLALLFLACFLPRACFALRWNQLWTDSVSFYYASVALEQGRLGDAFGEFGLNIYPMILWLLRAMFVNWEAAAQWWSLIAASAAVLPLFGWVRRQFDDRVAVIAGLLYAVHGKLIAMSCLAIRDPTFWLLFLLALYLLWRAITGLRWPYFLLAGVVLTLVVHLRTEGWLLLVPAVGWTVFRWPAVAGSRARLVLGTALCVAVIPATLLVLNLTWLRAAPQWSLLRRDHVAILLDWFGLEGPPAGQGAGGQGAAAPPAMTDEVNFDTINAGATMPSHVKARKLIVHCIKAYTYPLAFLAVVGTIAFHRVYGRREHLTLLGMGLLMMAAIWIRSAEHGSDPRYFLPIVLVSFPWMALGFVAVERWIIAQTQRHTEWTAGRRRTLTAVLAAAVALPSALDVKLSWGRYMVPHANLGRFILANYGPGRTIVSNTAEMRLVHYYSKGEVVGRFRADWPPADALPRAILARPELVLLWYEESDAGFAEYAQHIVQATGEQYLPAPRGELPPHWIVLVRRDVPRRTR